MSAAHVLDPFPVALTQPLLSLHEVLAIWTPPRKPSSIRIRHFLWQVESHLDPANGYCNGCERDSSFHMTFLCKPKINKLLATSKFHAQIFSNSVKCGFTLSPSAKFAQRPSQGEIAKHIPADIGSWGGGAGDEFIFCTWNYALKSTAGWWQLKYFFMFIPKIGDMIQFDNHIFQMGWNHQLNSTVMYSQ